MKIHFGKTNISGKSRGKYLMFKFQTDITVHWLQHISPSRGKSRLIVGVVLLWKLKVLLAAGYTGTQIDCSTDVGRYGGSDEQISNNGCLSSYQCLGKYRTQKMSEIDIIMLIRKEKLKWGYTLKRNNRNWTNNPTLRTGRLLWHWAQRET